MDKSASRRCAVLAAVYAIAFLALLWTAYAGNLPTHLLNHIPYYDKIGHVILYAIPTYLGHRLLRRQLSLAKLSLPLFPTLFTLFTATEESLQGLSPHRTLDAGDLACSFLGIAIGYLLAQRQDMGRNTKPGGKTVDASGERAG